MLTREGRPGLAAAAAVAAADGSGGRPAEVGCRSSMATAGGPGGRLAGVGFRSPVAAAGDAPSRSAMRGRGGTGWPGTGCHPVLPARCQCGGRGAGCDRGPAGRSSLTRPGTGPWSAGSRGDGSVPCAVGRAGSADAGGSVGSSPCAARHAGRSVSPPGSWPDGAGGTGPAAEAGSRCPDRAVSAGTGVADGTVASAPSAAGRGSMSFSGTDATPGSITGTRDRRGRGCARHGRAPRLASLLRYPAISRAFPRGRAAGSPG
jgi:hypothetical protein